MTLRWAATLLTLVTLCCSPALRAEPFVPADDAQVLERLPYTPGDPSRQLRARRDALARDPGNVQLAIETAREHIRRGRAEGDPRYFGYAQAALEPWWNAATAPADIMVLRAAIKQASHDFQGGLNDLNKVLLADPDNTSAALMRAIILQVQGRYAEAQRACAPVYAAVQRVSYLRLTALTCLASVASFNGQAVKSYELLRRALANSAGSVASADRQWALSTLADIAVRLGRSNAAETYFKAALASGEDAWLLGAYADFLLAQGRSEQVIELLKDETDNDTLLLLLALAEQDVGAPQLDEYVTMLRARFAASRLRSDQRHLREEARFTLELLRNPQEALRIAKVNWRVQHEPEDARIFLQAALAAGKPRAARPVLTFLARTGLEDQRLEALRAQARQALEG